ncbi:MAG: T9SS type A sorting domain-containing protein [Bacteroidota bacterium]
MKKFTLSVFSVCLGVASIAQVGQDLNLAKPKYAKKTNEFYSPAKGTPNRDKATFYTNDFSVAADWTIGTNDGTTDNWVIGTDVPSGSFPIDPIASTSAANGYALFDSDLLCSGNQRAWVALNTGVDCSAHPTVAVDFEQHFRSFQDQTFLEVSVDGGTTWTQFEVNAALTDNSSTANPELTTVNISSVAANQPDVRIRFFFYSEAGVTGEIGGCAYSWMVDDIAFRDVDPFDLELTGVYWGSTGYWGARLPYTMVPVSQIQPIFFGGLVSNAGSADQNDVVFAATGGAFTGVSAVTPLAAQTSDTLETQTQLTLPAVVGTTTVNFGVTSSAVDIDPSNNTASQDIEVTNSVYARDLGVIDGGSYNQGNGYEVGNVFDIFSTTQTNSVTFVPAATTTVGAQVYARVYGSGFNFYAESDLHTLTVDELGTEVTLTLQSTVDLIADSSYVIVVGTFGDGGQTDDLVTGTSGTSEDQTSFYFDQTDQTWYFVTSTPMVRLNMGIAPVVTSSDTDNNICEGGSLTLTSDATSGNVWSTSETTQSITVTTPGTYTVTANGLTSNAIVVTQTTIDATATDTGLGILTTAETGTYQWVDCNNGNAAIAGATAQDFTPTANGSYAVNITKSGCTEMSNCITINNVSLTELQGLNALSIHPNPATEKIAISFDLENETAVSVSVRDLSGKVVYSADLGNKAGKNSISVNTKTFANGIYVVSFETEKGIATEKLVINN